MTSLNLSLFVINNFYGVINCLNMNRVTICRAKCLDIKVPLKVLLTSCFCYNSKEKKNKISESKNKIKQSRYEFPCASSLTKCLKDLEKVTGFWKFICPFISKSLHIHFNPPQNASAFLFLNGLVIVTNKESISCKCFKWGNGGGYSL